MPHLKDIGRPFDETGRKVCKAYYLLYYSGAFVVLVQRKGQGEAIATNLAEMVMLKTPIISIVISEGGN